MRSLCHDLGLPIVQIDMAELSLGHAVGCLQWVPLRCVLRKCHSHEASLVDEVLHLLNFVNGGVVHDEDRLLPHFVVRSALSLPQIGLHIQHELDHLNPCVGAMTKCCHEDSFISESVDGCH